MATRSSCTRNIGKTDSRRPPKKVVFYCILTPFEAANMLFLRTNILWILRKDRRYHWKCSAHILWMIDYLLSSKCYLRIELDGFNLHPAQILSHYIKISLWQVEVPH